MKNTLLKKISLILLSFLILLGTVVFLSNKIVSSAARGRTFDEISSLPSAKTGLLLGTSKYVPNGNLNLYFKNRIDATVELFKSGKIHYIIISGDNSRSTYDEPTDMKIELIKSGIDSNKIYLDYAGFRTFDSVIRLREIFGQRRAIIISQKFHNERAIYIADKLNMELYGYNARDVGKYYGFKTMVREEFARVKVLLDFIFGVKPKFLGEKIEIK